jgi:uncharacterized protein
VPRELDRGDLLDLARGAALLGTGGGGDPYVGRLMVEQAMRQGGRVVLRALDEVEDDDFVIPTAMMGAPTIMLEKLPSGREASSALRALEEHLGRRATVTMPIECGGLNSTIPLVVGAQLGLDVVDADGMGRAFPELQMETFHVYGVSGSPMAIANEHGDTVILSAHDNRMMEWIARGVTMRMGGAASIAEYAMDGRTARRVSIAGTISLGIRLGECLRLAREAHRDPFAELVETLADTPYQHGRTLFEGKVADVDRRTDGGFVKGHATIVGQRAASRLDLSFQNEHLLAVVDGEVLAMVPDLICVLEADTAEPITTEGLRYGQRVRVMGISTPDIMRTPEALAVFGPRAFGLDVEFRPVETAVPAS